MPARQASGLLDRIAEPHRRINEPGVMPTEWLPGHRHASIIRRGRAPLRRLRPRQGLAR